MFGTKKSSTGTGQVIDCAKDPLDLRPAVDGIMAAIERVRANLADDQPIFVPIGESHSMPTHVLLQAALLKALADKYGRDNIAFGIEHPHNFLEQIITQVFEISIPDHLRGQVTAADVDGQFALAAFRAMCTSPYAPVAKNTLYHYISKLPIRTSFNDAATHINNDDDLLDLSDLLTAALVREHYPKHDRSPIDMGNVQGMRLRNIFMADRARAQQEAAGAKIYVQNCGRIHLFGDKGILWGTIDRHKYEHSLVAQFRAAGTAVVPVFPEISVFSTRDVPQAAMYALESGVVIKNLDISSYNCNKPYGEEAEFLARIMTHSNITDVEIIDKHHPNNATDHKTFRSQIRAQIPLWIAEAQAVL